MALSNEEVVSLLLQVTGAESLDALKEKAGDAKGALEKLAESADKAEGSSGGLKTGIAEVDSVLDGLASGGLKGAVDSALGLAAALGPAVGVAAAATAAAMAFNALAPIVKQTWTDWREGANKVPESADAFERMADQLRSATKELDELRGKQSLTNAELERYNELLGETAALEKDVAEARSLDLQRKKETAPDKQSADAVSDAVKAAGGIDKVVSDLLAARPGSANAAQAQLDQAKAERDRAVKDAAPAGTDPRVASAARDAALREHAPKIAEAEKVLADSKARALADARSLASRALAGDQDAIKGLDRSLPGKGFGAATTDEIARQAEGERVAKENLKAGDEQARRDKTYLDGRQKARDKIADEIDKDEKKAADEEKKARDKRIADNQRALERFTRLDDARAEKTEREEAKAAADAEREAEKERVANLPENRLKAVRADIKATAADVAMGENNGEFSPAQLEGIVNEASANAAGPDLDSVRAAVYRAAFETRRKIQAEIDKQMGAMSYGGDPYWSGY